MGVIATVCIARIGVSIPMPIGSPFLPRGLGAPGSKVGKAWIAFNLHAPTSSIGKVKVQIIEFVLSHNVHLPLKETDGEEVARHVYHK